MGLHEAPDTQRLSDDCRLTSVIDPGRHCAEHRIFLSRIIGFIGALAAVPFVFSDLSKQIGAWYPPYLAFSAVVGFVCMIGLWMMKKWGIIIYAAFCGVNQVVLLAFGIWNIFALIIPGIVIAVAFSKYKLME
jgi:hypothetical protein